MLLSRAAAGAILFATTATAVLVGTPASAHARPPGHGAPAGAPHPPAPQSTCRSRGYLEGSHYSAVQVARLARDAGFRGYDWTVSVAVAEAESAGWTRARHINTGCSVDRGLWQINSYWHPEVSDSCAFSPPRNARAAHTIRVRGGWRQWSVYNSGAYRSHLAQAQAAVDQVSHEGGDDT